MRGSSRSSKTGRISDFIERVRSRRHLVGVVKRRLWRIDHERVLRAERQLLEGRYTTLDQVLRELEDAGAR